MSFGISIGDILMLSGLAYSIGKTLTTGRKSAPEEFQEVQNQLFAISNALRLLSATLNKEGPTEVERAIGLEEDEILGRMIENCRSTLQYLDKVIKSYPELQSDSKNEHSDENTRKGWRRELKENIKKIKWTAEGADLDKLRHNLATHVNALNLAIAARSCIQTDRVKAQVDLVHGMLGDIHEWYLSNLKDAPTRPDRSRREDSGITRYKASPEQPQEQPELTFSVVLDLSNDSLCPKAGFNPEWLRTQGTRVFYCLCGNHDDLDYTLLPVSLLVRLTTTRPSWKIYAFSRAYNSVVSLLLSNIPSTYLAEFEREVVKLALLQGLRSSSTAGANSMLMYTSVQEDGRGSLSVLNTQGDTAGFRQGIRSVTVTSNGFQYIAEAIDSVQMLYYMTILFPDPNEATEQENPGLLPCRDAEVVLHTKTTIHGSHGADITQLVVQFDHLTVVDEVGNTPGVVLRGVKGKASLENDEQQDIHQADIELSFTSREAADSCRISVKFLQRHLFLSYLQSQRLGEIVQFRRNIGDVMIRDMQLIDAQATIVQDPTTNEQRMIVNSKCGSKFVTMILPAASPGPLLMDRSRNPPNLPAFFIDISAERTRIVEQSSGISSTFALDRAEDTNRSLCDV
ncbi:uncharacterized protein PAC_01140 [Phialocephala subalpina]|uniref:Fungal N-terminal domain-containing protein n=1 Tax=Phialocephala subalpina TaxID=576137 RepID=A0A1L7WER8_9HELO|nr:uncharacterized protein PAC_01140 [Phialocephala subalpina]